MKRFFKIAVLLALVVIMCATNASAWEVIYNASTDQLPAEASPAWTSVILGANTATVSNDVLYIQHVTGSSYYSREEWAIDAGVPVTMETVMCVGESSIGAPQISIQTKGCYAVLNIYADRLQVYDWVSQSTMVSYGDFTTSQTIRMAYDGGTNVYAWVNSQPTLSWTLSGSAGQNGISFGTYNSADAFDSYWQYVAYSKQFLPVPEPATALALICGLGGLVLRLRKL